MAENNEPDYTQSPYNIAANKALEATGMRSALGTKENVANKQKGTTAVLTALGSDDTLYPSSKLAGANFDNTVKRTGDQTINGTKTFNAGPLVPTPPLP